ncbi:MAG: hypothetical protein WAW06_10615 [bacterium]
MDLGRTHRILLFLGLVSLQMVALPLPAAGASTMGLPLPGDPCPTSSFGSRRATHIHAGLDFSTGGRIGIPVLAVDACRIWRISVKNGGYGRALYAELPGGQVVVYGHLSRFAAPVERVVEAEQIRLGCYEVELYPEAGAFEFAAGETLAFSGDTGAGPPHLHFELRSGKVDFDNLSPLPGLTALRDSARPTITGIRIEPVGPDCSLGGEYEPVTLTPAGATDALAVTGPFAVSVKATDVALCERVVSPTSYEAYVDGELVWKLNLVEFPFAKTHFVKAIYELVGGSAYVRVSDPYDLDFEGFDCYRPLGGRLFTQLTPGAHVLRVAVGDPWANYDDVVVPFTYGSLPDFETCRLEESSAGIRFEAAARDTRSGLEVSWRAAGGAWSAVESRRVGEGWAGEIAAPEGAEVLFHLMDPSGMVRDCILAPGGSGGTTRIETVVHSGFVEIYARTPSPPRALPLAEVRQGDRMSLCALQPIGRNSFRGCYLPSDARGAIEVKAMFEFDAAGIERIARLPVEHLLPGDEVGFEGERFAVWLRLGRGGAGTLVELSERSEAAHEGFDSCFARLDFKPDDAFFERGMEIRVVPLSRPLGPKVGLFSLASGVPGLVAAFGANDECRARVYDLGPLAILRDTRPPALRFTGQLTRTRAGLGTFAGITSDAGSGIASGSIRAFVDDQVAIASYDPDTGGITVRTTKPLPYGTHRLRLEADDRLGNSARSEIQRELVR